MPACVLVVEDEPAIQALLKINLQQAGYDVLCAASAAQAQELVACAVPDLIILDWMLPDTSGIKLARQLRAQHNTRYTPLIMLTARSSEQDIIAGLEAGADDYISKPFSVRELMARIKSLLRRHAPQLTLEPISIAGLELNPETRQVHAQERAIALSPAEFRLLHFLLTHPDRVYSRSQLLDLVWDKQSSVEERTVDVHIRRLRKALEPAGLSALIKTIRGSGYSFTSVAKNE